MAHLATITKPLSLIVITTTKQNLTMKKIKKSFKMC